MHVVALGAPGVAAPGKAMRGERTHHVAARRDGIGVGLRGPVRAGRDADHVAVRVDRALHVLHIVDVDGRALPVLGLLAGTPGIAAHILDRELLVALKDLLEHRLDLVRDGLIDRDGLKGRGLLPAGQQRPHLDRDVHHV